MTANDYSSMSKKELHHYAKAAGIKYGKLSLMQIREQLAKVDTKALSKPSVGPKKASNKGKMAKSPKQPRAERKGTKMQKAIALFDKTLSRKDVIAKFMSEAKLTKAGAATYYALVKKKISK